MNNTTIYNTSTTMTEPKVSNTLQKYYDKIFQDGKLVNVHIGMWGMSFNLTEKDIKLDTKLPNTIKLGKKMLIKIEVYNKFKTLEQKIRKYLYVNSFDFPLVGKAHFVPKTRFVEVFTQLSNMRTEYMAMVDEFVEKYEAYKAEALEFYQEHKDTVNIEDLESVYPPSAKIRDKFYMDVVAYEIALPTEFKEINLQDELAREEVREQAKVSYNVEYAKQLDTHMSKIETFMEEATNTLRSSVVEFCTNTLQKIKDHEVVSDANIRTLLSKVKSFKDMNFMEDHAIESKLAEVEKFVSGNHDFVNDKAAIATLQQHLTAAVEEAKNVTDVVSLSGEYFRKLSV